MKNRLKLFVSTLALGLFAFSIQASAHCDALDGPIIGEARAAFSAGDVTPTLKWVMPEHEQEIRDAFQQAHAVAAEDEAYALAELWFLETLIRVHREGEGAAYTGLKPAGEIDPAVGLADAALVEGSADALADRIGTAVTQEIQKRFEKASALQAKAADNVDAGREFVHAYVEYVHFVEAVHNSITGTAGHAH